MILTDTHCHLGFPVYQEDLPEVIARAERHGVERILIPGIDIPTSRQAVELAVLYPVIFAAVGIHPNSAATWDQNSLVVLRQLCSKDKVVAVGEIGLDYYRDRSSPSQQRKVLQHQLTLAAEEKLPVILHVRNRSNQDRSCMNDILAILTDWVSQIKLENGGITNRCGVLHSFSGNVQDSKRACKIGFYIGITGPITYPKADAMREVVKNTPLDRILVETDGPFLTPHPYRGKRNEPAHVRYVVEKISDLLNLPALDIANQTSANADRLFHWRESL